MEGSISFSGASMNVCQVKSRWQQTLEVLGAIISGPAGCSREPVQVPTCPPPPPEKKTHVTASLRVASSSVDAVARRGQPIKTIKGQEFNHKITGTLGSGSPLERTHCQIEYVNPNSNEVIVTAQADVKLDESNPANFAEAITATPDLIRLDSVGTPIQIIGEKVSLPNAGVFNVRANCTVGAERIIAATPISTVTIEEPPVATASSANTSSNSKTTSANRGSTKSSVAPQRETKTIQAGPNAGGIASRMTARAAEAGWSTWSCVSQPNGSYNCSRTKN
ncbi:MAG: hypothetical protein PHH14_00485 [Candidatus Margulisbacteria bacterium]|nr:hypothetical protein [Candidatus Margulisiibacteriota bacterium]